MGLDNASVKFLCGAKSLGVDFTHTAMIGRQSFWPGEPQLRRVFSVLGIMRDANEFLHTTSFGEPFFALLGAKSVTSVDVSSYESATVIHDMNNPIPEALRGRFTAVHDGGTIEHVFGICQALKNCMEMVQVGGHFTQVNEANNYMGHGFWQFSPELIFRAFSPLNGFEIQVVLLHENVPGGGWYVVSDPDEIKSRVELCNSSPVYILTIAKKTADVEVFATPPQQSDYVALWARSDRASNTSAAASTPQVRADVAAWRAYIPSGIRSAKYFVQRVTGRDGIRRGFNQKGFRRIDEDAVLRGEFRRPA